jgi:hypothetical protein
MSGPRGARTVNKTSGRAKAKNRVRRKPIREQGGSDVADLTGHTGGDYHHIYVHFIGSSQFYEHKTTPEKTRRCTPRRNQRADRDPAEPSRPALENQLRPAAAAARAGRALLKNADSAGGRRAPAIPYPPALERLSCFLLSRTNNAWP